MRRLFFLVFLGTVMNSFAQSGSRWHFTFGPSVTIGNRFQNNQTSVSAPDITGAHHIQAMFSPLWGFPNPQYSGMENLGRKLHLGVQYERFFNTRFAVVTGLEMGARGYIIKSDFSNDLLVSYRTFSLPLYASFSPFKGNFWVFRQNIGGSILMSSTIPERVRSTINLNQRRVLSPQLYAGLELIHKSFSAPFSFEVSYTHGFVNLIDHQYLGLDYITPVGIQSTGSAFHFKVKYLLKERIDPIKPQLIEIQKDIFNELAYRNVKDPIPVKVDRDTIRICVTDDQTVDGDSIAIEFNQRLIHQNIMIQREGYCFDLILNPTSSNTLIVHALNEGKIPPNTCVIEIQIGEEKKEVRLKSDMKNSGAIQFKR